MSLINKKNWKLYTRVLVLLMAFTGYLQTVQSQVNYTFAPAPEPVLSRIEYYIDTDPGYGFGINVPFAPGTSVADQILNIDPASLTSGVHRLGIRSRDANGAWSLENSWMFYKPYGKNGSNIVASSPAPDLTHIEYYIDTDPGYGKGIAIAINPENNLPDFSIPINVTDLSAGVHKVGFRSRDANGAWSLDNFWEITVPALLAGPSIITTSITKTIRCANDSIDVSYHITGTYNSGNKFNVELSDATGAFTSPTIIGSHTGTGNSIVKCKLPSHFPDGSNYRVRVSSTNPVLAGITGADAIIIYNRPTAQTITGLSSANENETWPYIVPTATNSSWNWLVINGTKTNGGITNSGSIQWDAGIPNAIKAGKINIVETNQFGCIGDTSLQAVNIYKLRIGNSLSTSTPCLKDSVTITLNTDGSFYTTSSANQFIAELSNASGVFTTPVAVANITSAAITGINQAAGILKIGIPGNLPNGTNYRIRVRSTNPVFIGDTSIAISIQKPNLGVDLTRSKCIGFGYDLRSNFTDAAFTYKYFSNIFELLARPDSVDTGMYQVIGANSVGCTDTAMVTIINNPKPNLGADQVKSKCIGFTYSLTGIYTDAALSFAYFTNAFAIVPNEAAVETGVYNIVATNADGCKDTAQVTVTNFAKPNLGADITRSKCIGFTFSLAGVYSDASLTYTYFSSAFETLPNANVNDGVYNIVATNVNGCKDTAQVTVTNFPKPNLGVDITRSTCVGFGFNLTTVYTDVALTYTYFTQAYAVVGSPATAATGVYNIVATNTNGCRDTAQVTVNNFIKPTIGADITGFKCAGFGYNLVANYSNAALTYNFYTQGFGAVGNPSAVDIGVYNVVATNSDGCRDTAIITVTNFAKPNLGANITRSKCLGFTYDLSSVYNTAGLTYTYFTQSFESIANAAAVETGLYNVVATNADGCKDTAVVTVTNFVKPNLGADITRSKCLGFTYSLAGVYTDASLTYTYFTNVFAIVPNAATVNDGVYNIVATNANGCKDTAQVTVTNFPKPNLGVDITRSTCIGFGFNLTTVYTDVALTYTYFTQAFASVSMPTSVATGLYNIVATNTNGCRDTAQVTVINFVKPNIGADITGFKCAGFGYSLVANYSNAALTYNFYTQGFALVGNPTSVDIGVYNVVATNSDGCRDTAIITVTNFAKPNLGANITRSKCLGFTYDLSSVYNTAGLTYSYFTQSFESIANAAAVETGVYNIVATNADGCKDTAVVTVTNFVKPNLGADITRSKCLGFTYSLVGVYTDASLTYAYFTNAFAIVPNAATVNDGVYNIVATNANGCKDTAQVTVNNYPKPNLGTDITRSTCTGFGFNLTTIYSDVTLSYAYLTQAFATVSTPTSVGTGLYNIVATNSNGCKDTAQVTVNNFIKPTIGADITGFKCAGFGYNLVANYSNAALTYNFYTQGFALVGNPSSVDIGIYNVVATNSDGCMDTAIITVTNFAKPNLGANITRSKCLGFTYDLSTVYNTAGLTYSYFTQAFESIANAAAVETGVYNIIATNADGCKDTAQVTVTNFVKPNLGADITLYHVCAGETTNLVPLYNTTGLTVNWNTVNITAATPGVYRLIVTNTSGCTDTAFVKVILDVATWTGAVSNNWHTAGNWNTNAIPTLQTHVIIPAGKINQIAINTADAEASSIQVRAGAGLQLSANRKLLLAQKCTLLPPN